MSNEQDIAEASGPGLTFREKSLWVTLVSTVALYAFYFWRAFAIGDRDPVRVGVVFAGVVIATIAVQSVVHAVLALVRRPERADERDRAVAVTSARNAYYVLQVGVWGALGVAVLALGAFWVAHAALLAVVIAEVTRCASQLAYYRRGPR